MGGSVHTNDFLTTLTWVVIVAGAVLSIVGYVRLGGACYPCSPGGGGLCYSTEYQFDLAAMLAGFTTMLGGFAGFAIVRHDSRKEQSNDSSTWKDPNPSYKRTLTHQETIGWTNHFHSSGRGA